MTSTLALWRAPNDQPTFPLTCSRASFVTQVQPGVMIVEGWKWSNPEPAELKIEVFWGVGFMGFWLGSHPETGPLTFFSLAPFLF